jgi:CRP/FNR family transcriptional regulator
MSEGLDGAVSAVRHPASFLDTESVHGPCAGMDSAALERMVPTAKRKSFEPKHVIYRQGDPADSVFAVRCGLVKLIRYSPDGRARIVRLHGKDDLFGLGGLVVPAYEHTAVAVDEVEVCAAPVRIILRLKKENPHLYCRLLETWCGCLGRADVWITDFSTGSIRARVARLVNFLSDIQFGPSASTEVTLLTCEEMAAVLGVTVESVSRTLAEFKRRRILRSVRRRPPKRYERDAWALQRAAEG